MSNEQSFVATSSAASGNAGNAAKTFQLLSQDPSLNQTAEERIAARKARLQARLRKGDEAGSRTSEQTHRERQRISKQQLATSRQIVDELQRTATDAVKDILVRNDVRALQRRLNEENHRQQRLQRIEADLEESAAANRKIREQWDSVADTDIPQELKQSMDAIRAQCDVLLRKKDAVIAELRKQITEKTSEYQQLLEDQAQDVDDMVKAMTEQMNAILQGYKTQLKVIEETFIQEREQLLDANKAEIDALFARRRQMEVTMNEDRTQREQRNQKVLDEVRARDAEVYNKKKIELESRIQLLEQQLEEMRATYQLNRQKLNYNSRVLIEMDLENKDTSDHHKQRLKKMKERLASYKARYAEQDKRFRLENKELTEDFKRTTAQFKALQKKYKHFQQIDNNIYKEVWQMNEANVFKCLEDVLTADRIIHTQLLNREWTRPSLPTHELSSVAPAVESDEDVDENEAKGNGKPDSTSMQRRRSKERAAARAQEEQGRFSNEQIREMIFLLAGEAAFLVEQKVRDSVKDLPHHEQAMLLADNILSSIGVTDKEDLDELAAKFYDNDNTAELPTVHPNDVIAKVREFVATRSQSGKRDGSGAVGGGVRIDPATLQKNKKKSRAERAFWTQLSRVIDTQRYEVWKGVESGLVRYNKLLSDREKLMNETQSLAEQNKSLRSTLETYLHHPQNDDLLIPPTRIIRVDRS